MNIFIYGDNVDTDVIIPARHLTRSEPQWLAAHCMEDIDPGFAAAVRPGDVLVAGQNFGCGSSREHAPLALKACGLSCVIAASFARIFFRNAVNIGLPILETPEAAAGIRPGDDIALELARGRVINRSTGVAYQTPPPPDFLREIMEAGGLMERIKRL